MKTYAAVIEYLYARLPMFTRDGASAIRPDLHNTLLFCAALGNPQDRLKAVHVAGTNGKGSSSHMIAAILGQAGLKTALYTSPHLVDFRERIRIDGIMVPEAYVISFVNQHRQLIEDICPSFFEVTLVMAFAYFAEQNVDIAVIEVGLGGRLDSTNVIRPLVSLITNIGMDHMNLLGNTLTEIAAEKAGIIKAHTPAIISERDPLVADVFEQIAALHHAPLTFASDTLSVKTAVTHDQGMDVLIYDSQRDEEHALTLDLRGSYQRKNILGVLAVIDELRLQGYAISAINVQDALAQVQRLTGLQGRWQTLSTDPWVICDTGHNEAGIREVVANLAMSTYDKLHIVIGAMADKDLSHMLPQLPTAATYYFCSPEMPRALLSADLQQLAAQHNLLGDAYASIPQALQAAIAHAHPGDLIFVGGSNFVVASVLTYQSQHSL